MKTRMPRNLFRDRPRNGVHPPETDRARVRLTDRDVTRLLAAERKIGRCLLCKGPAAHAPVWVTSPEESRRLGSPEGEARIIIVGMCPECRRMPDVFKRVEEKLYASAAAALASPEAN